MARKRKKSRGREVGPAERDGACPCADEDRLLEAAGRGWAVTVRYSILVSVTRWPAILGGTGAVTLAAGVARARGWI